MFAGLEMRERRRRSLLLISVSLHALLLWVLVREPRPVFVQLTQVARGNGGKSVHLVYLARAGADDAKSASSVRLERPPEHLTLPRQAKAKPKPAPPAAVNDAKAAEQTTQTTQAARAGSPYGSLAVGAIFGHEVRPALPTTFNDPVVPKGELPPGVAGDVVVEITIDVQGSIIGMKLVRGLGYGVEEKCLAALQHWRFRPAMQDGVAIPSQQYVYFHLPNA